MSLRTKMWITKLRLINWHYFNNYTIEFKDSNLFSGDNGAGKSTILDAIQMLLTTNIHKFNQAANSNSKVSLLEKVLLFLMLLLKYTKKAKIVHLF